MHFSRDGVQWRLARHFQLQTSSKLRLGFAAHTVSNPHFAATFSEIVYRASAPKNMRQLEPADVVNQ
jgi:regulation of enolase protein 1 (concanavalin A-like superfamily)